jgi:DNA-binding transcriptional MerR regulator
MTDPTPQADPPPDELRVDDLARAAGVTTTTIRLYQSKGLLPAPRLVGRTGYYGPAHLTRLRTIAQLQEQGFSLAGIGALIRRWEQGGQLADLVGAEEQVGGLLGRRREVVLDPAELVDRFPTAAMEPALLQRAARLGLVDTTDDGRLRVPDARFLDSGAALAHMGIPLEDILAEWEALSEMTDRVAGRFADLFERDLLPADWRERLGPDDAVELAATLDRLRTLGEQVLLAALDDSIARVAASRFAELVDDGAHPTGPEAGAPSARVT